MLLIEPIQLPAVRPRRKRCADFSFFAFLPGAIDTHRAAPTKPQSQLQEPAEDSHPRQRFAAFATADMGASVGGDPRVSAIVFRARVKCDLGS